MIVVDASWLIALADNEESDHVAARAVLADVGGEPLAIHPLTLAEYLVGPAKLGLAEAAEDAVRAAILVLPFDEASPGRLATLRSVSGLRLLDVVVLDAAMATGRIATFDAALAAAARGRNVENVCGSP